MFAARAILLALLVQALSVVAADVFKVGVVTIAGPGLGETFLAGLEWWRDKVNQNGGLRTNDDPPVVMEVELVTTFASTADEAAQKILDFHNGTPEYVHAMVNTFQQYNVAVNDIMALNQIETVLMHCSGGTPSMYGLVDLGVPRWSFQFGIMVPSSDYLTGIFAHIMSFGQRLPNKRVAFFRNTGNSFADFTCGESIIRAQQAGLEVAEIFTYSGTDYETVMPAGVAALKENSTTQIVMGCTWLQDGLRLQQEIVAQQLDLLANINTIAPTNPLWEATFPRDDSGQSLGDYVLSPSQWHHTQNFLDYSSVGDTMTFAAEFYANNSRYPDYLLASCTAAGIVLERAVNKVSIGSFQFPRSPTHPCSGTDCIEEKLRLMIRDYDEDTMYGRVRFSRYNQNVGHDAAVVQLLPLKGQAAVLPEETVEDRLFFPAPTWEKRLSCNTTNYTNCEEPPVFRIGVLSPDTEEGRNISQGLLWWQRKVNAAGGIRARNGVRLQVELRFKDTTVDGEPNNALAASETSRSGNRLTDPVQALVSTFYGHTVAINTEMNEEGIDKVLLHCTGGVPSWYGTEDIDGQPTPRSIYSFGMPIPTTNYAESIFNFVSKRLTSSGSVPSVMGGPSSKIAFFRNVENEIVDYTCGEAILQARASGLEVVGTLEYNASEADYATKMADFAQLMASNDVRMFFGCTWVEDGIRLQKTIVQQQIDLHLNVILFAPKTREWLVAFPPDADGRSSGDYVVCPTAWHHTQTFQDSSSVGNSSAFLSEYRSEHQGEAPDANVAACAAAGIVLEKAMAKIPWTGEQQFRDNELRVAVRDIRIDTVFGEVRFDNLNQNVGHDPAVIQIHPGDAETIRTSVLPETNSQSNLIFPAPTWEWRNGCQDPRPNGESSLYCEEKAATDDATMTYVIIICVAVPLLFFCALYFSRMFHGVLRRRRTKFVQRLNAMLEKALWEQDPQAAREAENKLRPYRGKSMFGFSYHVKNSRDVAKEQSLHAGIGVGYLLSDEFLKVAKAACGDKVHDAPTFHDLKQYFFMRDSWEGLEDTFFYKSFHLTCPRDGLKGVALTDTFPRQHRQKQTHFLSWSWAYTIRQVRSGLDFWIQSTGIDPGEAFLFMCFFVNNQHRILVSGNMTGSDELDRIFEGNLVRIGKMIALLDNWRKPVYLTRIWTIFEQYVAVTNQIEVKIILPRDAEANLFMAISTGTEGIKSVKDSLCTVNSATADAWSPQDKEAIQAKILAGCGFEEINEHVRQVMIAWIGNVVIGAMQRVVKGEDVLASAHKWASTSSRISEHRDFAEDLDSLQHVRSLL